MSMEMLKSHPRKSEVDVEKLHDMVKTIWSCAGTCNICADACLAEDDVKSLAACIRMDLDCAMVCDTMGAMLSRITEANYDVINAQLQACVKMCQACGAECRKHAKMEHCRICADTCDDCADKCQKYMKAQKAAAAA